MCVSHRVTAASVATTRICRFRGRAVAWQRESVRCECGDAVSRDSFRGLAGGVVVGGPSRERRGYGLWITIFGDGRTGGGVGQTV
jgi:hypothetical protein